MHSMKDCIHQAISIRRGVPEGVEQKDKTYDISQSQAYRIVFDYDKVILFETKYTSYFNMIGAGGMNVHPRRRRIARERYVESIASSM